MPSHNLAFVQLCGLDIIGYSVGGEETVVALPQLDVCFDIGKAPDQVIPINFLLLTHGHIDHAAGFAYYLSHRQFNGQTPGTLVAPKQLLGPIRQILDGWASLDGNRIPVNLIGVGPGDEVQIKPNLIARAFPTDHCKGSLGYCVAERRKKLRSQYSGLTGPQLVELKRKGVTIDYPVEIPIVSYLGDTRYLDYSSLEYVVNSKILIVECTFFEQDHTDRADAGRHMHLQDLPRLLASLRNEYVVLIHVTQRTSLADARRLLRQTLDKGILDKIVVLMDHRK